MARPPREDTEPWYKQFWPWFLISLPGSVVIASMITINIAVTTSDGLVSDDYYKEGLGIHKDAASAARAQALGVAGQLTYEHETGAVRLVLDKPVAGLPQALALDVFHPTRKDNDRNTLLTQTAPGIYVGRVEPVIPANWKLTLNPEDEEWRVVGRLQVPGDGTARLE
jgi:hypothetical protein